MTDTEKRVKDAAEVAAEAASAGVDSKEAVDLASGEKKVVVIKPASRGAANGERPKRWEVIGGKPVEDPDGQYESFAQAYKVAALEAAKAADPTTFFKFLKEEGLIGEKGTGDDFSQTLAKKYLDSLEKRLGDAGGGQNEEVQAMRNEIASLREEIRKTSDPLAIVTKAKELTEGLKAAGLIPQPTGSQGDSIDVVREKHRHDEKMEEIKIDKDYKEELTKIAGDLPETIGRGIGGEIKAQKGAKGESKASSLPYLVCSEKGCGTKIFITPETGSQVTCPREGCGTIYARGGEVEPVVE